MATDEPSFPLADQATLQLMQETGYDAVTLGSQELSRELPALRRLLKPIQHTVVSANLRNNDSNHTRAFKPYIIRRFGRRSVAYVGFTMPDNASASEQFAANLQQSINQARLEGANYVVLLTNLPDNTTNGNNTLYITRIVADLTGIDVVLDGSPSTPVPMQVLHDRDGHDVILSRTGEGMNYIGKLIIAPDGLITTQLMPAQRLRFKSRRITQLLEQLPTQ